MSFATVIIVSYATKYVFESRLLPKKFDLFQCVVNIPDEMIVLKEPNEGARLTNGAPPGAIVVPGVGGGLGPPMPVPAGLVKHNAPGSGINPSLKINREDLLLMPPSADYERLVESRSPSPLPEHANRLLVGAAAGGTSSGDQSGTSGEHSSAADSGESSSESEQKPVQQQQQPATATTVKVEKETTASSSTGIASGDKHRSSLTRKQQQP